ncbi:hypothetical protein IQ37_01825 [Chryseobacterium piperi]|uniref:Lipoprotein n=1 Tax=Chryseobacterium piperi TaxID=558152 RepID=A0A086BLX2_9FLAO|nr:DUF6452 family protein [Chryseobacterium piperi]ASW75784.1 hypothetical protein CJF12_16845 [Chryseobacterium piperi]KFF29936.1 hypothetical protein IQ37_01825 [Chryseobacterium piperi]
MKYFKFLIVFALLGMLYSCGGDDDICESGEGTPRMKISFKSFETTKDITVDSLYVAVDYGSGKINLGKTANNTSRLIPLRVDDSPYTEIYFKRRLTGPESKVRVNYTTKASYVSPGCGVKKTYENLNSELPTPDNPVKKVEIGQNNIENEDKTNLFLFF